MEAYGETAWCSPSWALSKMGSTLGIAKQREYQCRSNSAVLVSAAGERICLPVAAHLQELHILIACPELVNRLDVGSRRPVSECPTLLHCWCGQTSVQVGGQSTGRGRCNNGDAWQHVWLIICMEHRQGCAIKAMHRGELWQSSSSNECHAATFGTVKPAPHHWSPSGMTVHDGSTDQKEDQPYCRPSYLTECQKLRFVSYSS